MSEIVFKIGGIGHRDLSSHGEYHYAQLCCHEIFSVLKKKYASIRAISALAEGADSLFAQMAIVSGVQLETVIPFKKFESDFQSKDSFARYSTLKKNSELEDNVNFKDRSDAAYRKSMEWVVFKSNLIVAIWDGKEVGSKGGTWEALTLCKILRKQFIHVNISEKTMHLYLYTENGLFKPISLKRNGLSKHFNYVN